MAAHGIDDQRQQRQAEKPQAEEPRVTDPVPSADLRNQAVERMRKMNVRHAQHAWQQRNSDPLSAYGLAFFYVHKDPVRRGRFELAAATKLWLAGPETQDLARLLYDLHRTVTGPGVDARFDPRTELANRVDNTMTADSTYAGIGVSSLDTHSGTWAEAREKAERDSDIPGQIRIVLHNTTIIICARRGLREFGAFQIHSTQSLDLPGYTPYPWSPVGPDDLYADAHHREVLRWMVELNYALWQFDNARLVAAHAQTAATRTGQRP